MPSLDLFWATFALGCVFGVAARAGNFCLLRGLRQTLVRPEPSDWGEEQAPQGAPALQAFALALAVALVGTQVLAMLGEISLSQVLVVRPRFSPLGALTGGLMFGVAWRWRIPVARGRWCCWRAATCGRCGCCCGWG